MHGCGNGWVAAACKMCLWCHNLNVHYASTTISGACIKCNMHCVCNVLQETTLTYQSASRVKYVVSKVCRLQSTANFLAYVVNTCMLGQCWPYSFIIGPALCQHWANLLCLLGCGCHRANSVHECNCKWAVWLYLTIILCGSKLLS